MPLQVIPRKAFAALLPLVVAITVIGSASLYAAPNPRPAADSDRVLAEGPPPLTQSMVDQRIAIWEIFLEVKVNHEQRDALQRAMVQVWKQGDKVLIQGTLEDIKMYGKEKDIVASRAANQSAYVDSLRKQPDEPVAKELVEIYDAAHPERKDFMRTHGMGDFVGEWKRQDAILASRGPNNTYHGASATDTLILKIYSDGHFDHQWSHSHCTGQSECCRQYGTNMNGAFSAEGSNLTLQPNGGTVLMRDACTPSHNFFKEMPHDPQTFSWSITHPNGKPTKLCLSDRPFNFNDDHKAAAQPVCYDKQP